MNLGRLDPNDAVTLIEKYKITAPTGNSVKISSQSNSSNNDPAKLSSSNKQTWIDALDGKNSALDSLGVTIFGQKKSNVNNSDAKSAVNTALKQIESGEYIYTTAQQLMDDLKNGVFGKLRWGF